MNCDTCGGILATLGKRTCNLCAQVESKNLAKLGAGDRIGENTPKTYASAKAKAIADKQREEQAYQRFLKALDRPEDMFRAMGLDPSVIAEKLRKAVTPLTLGEKAAAADAMLSAGIISKPEEYMAVVATPSTHRCADGCGTKIPHTQRTCSACAQKESDARQRVSNYRNARNDPRELLTKGMRDGSGRGYTEPGEMKIYADNDW